ncbi:MAG TPA: hypothetical protein DCQ06_14625 [Myxococcales bacterium]|nr:hypothetical protein [Myxococcales bacterium]
MAQAWQDSEDKRREVDILDNASRCFLILLIAQIAPARATLGRGKSEPRCRDDNIVLKATSNDTISLITTFRTGLHDGYRAQG